MSMFCVLLLKQRMDLGECPKLHDLALRADYENAAKHKDHYYDIEVIDISILFEVKIEKEKKLFAKTGFEFKFRFIL